MVVLPHQGGFMERDILNEDVEKGKSERVLTVGTLEDDTAPLVTASPCDERPRDAGGAGGGDGGVHVHSSMATRVLPRLLVICLLAVLLLGSVLGNMRHGRPTAEGKNQKPVVALSQDPITEEEGLNLRPIIGILSQELSRSMDNALQPHNYSSYIAASYVKFYESAGARVVPVLINQEDEYYHNIASSVNGVVFPGGSASITNSSGYGRAGDLLYQLLQKRDPPVPLLTTCLGFEMMMYLGANNTYPLTRCKASSRADPLYLLPDWESSRLLGSAPSDVLETFIMTNSTSNFHKYCVLPETFEELGLDQEYFVLSTSIDDEGVEYISTVEHKTLPYYGVQWHPEKNPFEWKFSSIPHSRRAIRAAQYIANFFVEEARHNNQTFATEEEEKEALIYNYCPMYTADLYSSSSFQQCYFFP
ncbi:gamma-glutamyl hydrolase-like isoform X1 [Portunus trituberculatus]|uniref:gamma-glutamyl hydrolase-like isoform X1 n=1 Tax=Portunus trituberculatus TaxID=210409 RepID=UPI001E1CDCB1|nr:gamma-glutamyl hydrolase-like isoform X1 [Portunus trituberculatus]